METKYKLKHFLDSESIELVLNDEEKKKDIMQKRLSQLQEMLGPVNSQACEGSIYNKQTAQTFMTTFFELISKELKEKDPAYHKKFWDEIRQKKGEAEIDFDYLEKKMPFLGAVNASVGIYRSKNNSPDLSSFIMPKGISASGLENLLHRGNFILKGDAAKNIGQYVVAAYVLPVMVPGLREIYAKMRKELNLPSV